MTARLPDLTMNDGHTIPAIGFGTWKMPAEETVASVESALATGYRHIATHPLVVPGLSAERHLVVVEKL